MLSKHVSFDSDVFCVISNKLDCTSQKDRKGIEGSCKTKRINRNLFLKKLVIEKSAKLDPELSETDQLGSRKTLGRMIGFSWRMRRKGGLVSDFGRYVSA
jgi:hypothetical protein